MTTDNKAVARWDIGYGGEFNTDPLMSEDEDGTFVLFTDHEQVVAELTKEHNNNLDSWLHQREEIAYLRTVLAASRAEVEGLRSACSGSEYALFLDAYYKACETSQPSDWHDSAMLAKQWEQRIDAEMEKSNEHQDQ